VFAPGPQPQEIEEIAAKLREAAGLAKEPSGVVAQNTDGNGNGDGAMDKVTGAIG
jgi:hypothetical protein